MSLVEPSMDPSLISYCQTHFYFTSSIWKFLVILLAWLQRRHPKILNFPGTQANNARYCTYVLARPCHTCILLLTFCLKIGGEGRNSTVYWVSEWLITVTFLGELCTATYVTEVHYDHKASMLVAAISTCVLSIGHSHVCMYHIYALIRHCPLINGTLQ